jgi:hypothetical protein
VKASASAIDLPLLLFSGLEITDRCVQRLGRTHGIEIFP